MDDLSSQANFPMGRRGHSRSPPRQAYQDDSRRREARYRDNEMPPEAPLERGHYGRHGYYDEGHPRRGGHGHDEQRYGGSSYGGPGHGEHSYPAQGYGGGYRSRDVHDYRGMYDEVPREEGEYVAGRHEDERLRSDHPHYRSDPSRTPDARSCSPPSRYVRGRSDSPMREAGRPTDTVILEGLPYSISSTELRDSLVNHTIAAEFPSIQVRLASHNGGHRAFVQFPDVERATIFIKEHFPQLPIQLTHSTDEVPEGTLHCYIHYARNGNGPEDAEARRMQADDWTCPDCTFINFASRTRCKICNWPDAANWQQNLTGETDAADVPSQILVVYPIAPFVTEDMFTQDVKRLEIEKPDPSKDNSGGSKLKSTAPNGNASGFGARQGSLHRTFLMRDAATDESFKYGFVEFWTLEDAAAAVTKYQRSKQFTVAACPVTVSTIHMGVFLPEDRAITPAIEKMSFFPLFNPTLRVRYRDYHIYPSQTIVTEQPPAEMAMKVQAEETPDAKTAKKRKADGALLNAATKKLVPMAGQMAMWQKKRNELRGSQGDGPDSNEESSGAAPENQNPNRIPVRLATPGNGDSSKTGAQAPIKISISSATKIGASPATDAKKTSPEPSGSSKSTETPEPVSYVDRERLMCLICMRRYKSVDEVNIHERSRNHKKAMEDEGLVKAALPRLAIRDKRQKSKTQESADSTPQYRDRAKERRQAYKQPSAPSTTQPSKPKPAPKPEAAPKPPKPAQSKGAGMLAKMGWTTGAGLGANNDGRTEVVATNAYLEGVGLGAEGGNLGDAAQIAERKTKNSYAEYLSSVQDKARARYNSMN